VHQVSALDLTDGELLAAAPGRGKGGMVLVDQLDDPGLARPDRVGGGAEHQQVAEPGRGVADEHLVGQWGNGKLLQGPGRGRPAGAVAFEPRLGEGRAGDQDLRQARRSEPGQPGGELLAGCPPQTGAGHVDRAHARRTDPHRSGDQVAKVAGPALVPGGAPAPGAGHRSRSERRRSKPAREGERGSPSAEQRVGVHRDAASWSDRDRGTAHRPPLSVVRVLAPQSDPRRR
jgi:hypothetical protein